MITQELRDMGFSTVRVADQKYGTFHSYPALYVVLDGNTAYVGATSNLSRRMAEHKGRKKGSRAFEHVKSWDAVIAFTTIEMDAETLREAEQRTCDYLKYLGVTPTNKNRCKGCKRLDNRTPSAFKHGDKVLTTHQLINALARAKVAIRKGNMGSSSVQRLLEFSLARDLHNKTETDMFLLITALEYAERTGDYEPVNYLINQ